MSLIMIWISLYIMQTCKYELHTLEKKAFSSHIYNLSATLKLFLSGTDITYRCVFFKELYFSLLCM